MKNIVDSVKEIEDKMLEDRRHIHQNPEIGHDLPKTTAYVTAKLREIGLEPKEICQSGIMALIGKGGKTLLLRADMDALPIMENTNLPFKSCNEYGHLCGHDMHTAILLGTARILKERESELKGTVKLMFQPAGEYGSGAKAMIEGGIMDNPRVDAAVALHVSADLEPGRVEYKPGIASASMDTFLVNVQGKGGHSSTPHLAIDPLMIVNSIYTMLNSLVGKEADPFETAVLTIGKMGGGTAANIIPDSAVLEGGLRCFNRNVREHIVKRTHEIIEDVTRTMRGSCTIKKIYTPSIYNDEALCSSMKPYIEEIAGRDSVNTSERPLSGTEDFSYISELVPSVFMWIGAGSRDNYPLHNPNVLLDERAMPLGASVLANCAINWLKDNV